MLSVHVSPFLSGRASACQGWAQVAVYVGGCRPQRKVKSRWKGCVFDLLIDRSRKANSSRDTERFALPPVCAFEAFHIIRRCDFKVQGAVRSTFQNISCTLESRHNKEERLPIASFQAPQCSVTATSHRSQSRAAVLSNMKRTCRLTHAWLIER